MDDHPGKERAVFDDDRGPVDLEIDVEIEEVYDMMFGVGAFRWAEMQALRRLHQAQAAAVEEAERQLRHAEREGG
jgi:hypothetical protein